MKQALITGASGLIGERLCLALIEKGYTLSVVTRSPNFVFPFPAQVFVGDLNQGKIEELSQVSFDLVVNLMGESIGQRWTDKTFARIEDSRIKATKHLKESLKEVGHYIGASAIGIYGNRGDELLTLDSVPAASEDPIISLCQNWEKAHHSLGELAARVSILRFGLVFSANGGAFEKMLLPFYFGAGGPIAGGQHWLSWIHIEDCVNLILKIIEQGQGGVVNLVSPEPIKQKELAEKIAEIGNKSAWAPTPSWALGLAFGKAKDLLLASQRVESSFAARDFLYPSLGSALKDLVQGLARNEFYLSYRQHLACPLQQVFAFFQNENNLEQITPDFLGFKVLGKSTPEIQNHTFIDYQLKLHGISLKWKTEILGWSPPHSFADNQVKGPYAKWYHQHDFKSFGSGTLMTDQIWFKLPLWPLSAPVMPLVLNDVKQIFNYRKVKTHQIFNKTKS